MNRPMPNNFIHGFQTFMQNPMQYISGIPQEYANDPGKAIQYLMDSGRINQQQYNQAKQIADQMKNNPMFQQMFKK